MDLSQRAKLPTPNICKLYCLPLASIKKHPTTTLLSKAFAFVVSQSLRWYIVGRFFPCHRQAIVRIAIRQKEVWCLWCTMNFRLFYKIPNIPSQIAPDSCNIPSRNVSDNCLFIYCLYCSLLSDSFAGGTVVLLNNSHARQDSILETI